MIRKVANCKPVELVWNHRNSVSEMVGQKIVGMASAWTDSNDNFVMLRVAVRPPYRRHGIATLMYQAVEAAGQCAPRVHSAMMDLNSGSVTDRRP